VDEAGNEQNIRFGIHHPGPPIELRYERPIDGSNIGHYTLADGTPIEVSGEYSCLFDAVSKKTDYESDLLRRGTANVMLNNFDKVSENLSHLNFADLLVGGDVQRVSREPEKQRPFLKRKLSPAAQRHAAKTDDPEKVKRHTETYIVDNREVGLMMKIYTSTKNYSFIF
jgi:hypothetical protein